MKAIRFYEHGGPEVLKWEEVALPAVGPRDVRVRHTAIGLNFIDVGLQVYLLYCAAERFACRTRPLHSKPHSTF